MSGAHDPQKPDPLSIEEIREFEALGVTVISDVPEESQEDDAFQVWKENWRAVTVFLSAETQWNWVAGMGFVKRTGLNYAGLAVLLSQELDALAILSDVRVIERGALSLFAELPDE